MFYIPHAQDYFKTIFRATQLRWMYRDFLSNPCPHTCIVSPVINIISIEWYIFYHCWNYEKWHINQNSLFILWTIFYFVQSMDWKNINHIYPQLYHVEYFIALKSSIFCQFIFAFWSPPLATSYLFTASIVLPSYKCHIEITQ